MLNRGVYLAPSAYEALFISTAHTDDVLDLVKESVREVLPKVVSPV
jgi:glutamate-1-semialdehyde 2,1-aminomutase